MMTEPPTLDPQARKTVLRSITYGLYVMTCRCNDEIAAGTVTWLSQASLSPPLIMLGVRVNSRLHSLALEAGEFAINVLADGQQDVAAAFFRPTQYQDGSLNGYPFEAGSHTGAPLLTDVPLWLEARIVDKIEKGDHTVLLAEVISAGARSKDAKSLALRDTNWSYGG